MAKHESQMQTGQISHIEFWKKILREEHKEVSESILRRLWVDGYKKRAKVNTELLKLIRDLRKRYEVGMISNTQEPHTSYNRKRGIFAYFNPCLLSHRVGLRKPDQRIFKLYLKKCTTSLPKQFSLAMGLGI